MLGLGHLCLLASTVLYSAVSESDLVFRVGAVIGKINQCSEMNDAHLGYKLFADMLDSSDKPLFVRDAAGAERRIRFNYTRYDDDCESKKHNALIQTLINEDKVHFLFGSTPVFAEQESVLANDAQRLLYHCCVGPDPIYEMDMEFIYGIQASNKKYSQGAAKSMALAGNVKKLFIFYLEDNIFTATTCQTAVTYSTDVLQQLNSEFGIVEVVKYTSADAAADPDFYPKLVGQAMSMEADAILGCDFKGPGFQIARAVATRGYYLKAMWLTVAPAYEDFADTLGPKATEHALTAVQWHPASTFADLFFGTAREYSERYDRAYGVTPSYVSAGASAAAYSLTYAIQDAFKGCTLPEQDVDADSLLFDAGLLECKESGGDKGIGYERVMRSLARQQINTFFGEVALNSYRRNVALTPITAQIQSGVLQATLPIDVANKALVMPKPPPVEEEQSSAEYIGTLHKEAFIAVVVIVVGSVLILCLAALLTVWRSKKHSKLLEHMLVVSPDDLLIINHPVRLCDGSYECGKAMHRNTLVALEPLTEVKQKEMELNAKLSRSKSYKHSSRNGSSVTIVKDSDPRMAFKEDRTRTRSTELGISNQPLDVPHTAYPQDDLEAPALIIQGPVSEGVEDLQLQPSKPSTSAANGAAALQGPPQATALQPRSKVNFNLGNTHSEDLDPYLQHPLRVSTSNAHFNLQGLEAPQLTRAQILRLVWRSKCLQHPSVLPVSGIIWSLPSVPQDMAVLVTECEELGVLTSVMDNKTMELDAVKMLDICKDLAQALAYLHAQTHPRLRPVLQPRFAGVMLNKHCRAKLRVPFTSLLDALALDRSDCTGFAADCFKSISVQVPPRALRSSSQAPARVSSRWEEELEDVQQFGLDVACILSRSHLVSQMSINPEELAQDSVLSQAAMDCLEEEYGDELAQLVLQCCAQDSSKRPSFTEIQRRLEELGPEMIKRAQMAHRVHRTLTTLSMSSGRLGAARADELLYEVFPEKVAESLKSGRLPDPEPYPCVSLFFSDIVGYTDICTVLSLEEVLNMLHRLYSRFDALSEDLDLFKVGTVGDAYMCVANVRCPLPDTHAAAMAQFAFGCGAIAKSEPVCLSRPELGNIRIRMGIHAGPVMGAVVGTMNRRFCLFGDTVNVASRMESTSLTDHIQCTKSFMRLLQQQWPECAMLAVPQGARPIKGKGRMYTYYLFPDEQQQQASECRAVSVGRSGRLTSGGTPRTHSTEGDRGCREDSLGVSSRHCSSTASCT
uniref:Guanylate cyclase domain-containing protein n=1 Tax=Dunaliella tertiolecta TaxID=3047 RepID=A0A7S3VRG4_DUNTE